MGKRGPKQSDGLLWHSTRGKWYRRYESCYKYFGPVGKKGKTPDQSVYDAARQEWLAYENRRMEHEISQPALAPVADAAFRLFDMRSRIRSANLLIEHAKSDDEIESIRQVLAKGLAELEPPFPPKQSKQKNPNTCGQVVDFYVDWTRKYRSNSHAADVARRLKNGSKSKGKTDRACFWLNFVGRDTPVATLSRRHFITYRDLLHAEAEKYRDWESIQKQPIPQKMKKAAPGLSPWTVNKLLAQVRAAFKKYHEEKVSVPEVLPLLSLLRATQKTSTDAEIFNSDDIDKLLKAAGVREKAMFFIALNMAASNEDMSGLNWNHFRYVDTTKQSKEIDWKKPVGRIYVDYPRHKTKRLRRLTLWKRTVKALAAWKRRAKHPTICFPNEHGGRLITISKGKKTEGTPQDNLASWFRQWKTDKGLNKLGSFKTFRKTTPSAAEICGGTEIDIKRLLGQAQNGAWSAYAMMVPETLDKLLLKIEKHLFKST